MEQKILTVAVPCYNSEQYLETCLKSLLPGRKDLEILIVNDGSTDGTLALANAYASRYPDVIRVISQENGGHGVAVNTGLQNASGVYFKVVDSDDKVEVHALRRVIATLRELEEGGNPVDLLLTNYVYDKVGVKHKRVMRYAHAMPEGRVFSFSDHFHLNHFQCILMHSVIFRTSILRESGLVLPSHTFYVDNLYLIVPMPYVKKLYYLDVDFYWYYIGRSDQSVNEQVMISRIDQQIYVTKELLRIYTEYEDRGMLAPKNRERYIYQYIDMMMCITSVLLIIQGTEEALQKKREVWDYARELNPSFYRRLRYHIFGIWMNLPGRVGRTLSVAGYKLMHRIFGFN